MSVNILKYIKLQSPLRFDDGRYEEKKIYRERKSRFRKFNDGPVDINELTKFDQQKFNDCTLLFGFSSRFEGNFNSFLEESVNSVYENALHPEKIAFSIVVDRQDKLAFYYDFLRSNCDKNIRFFISDSRLGVEGLHKYDKIIFDNLPTECSIFFDYSDDANVIKKNFDDHLFQIEKKLPDKIFILHTKENSLKFLPDLAENPMLLPWLQKTLSPASLFPVISRRIIEIARDTIKELKIEDNWSPLSNTWIFDCYVDYIAHKLKLAGFGDRIFYSNMVERTTRYDKFNDYNNLLDDNGLNKSDRAFVKMYSAENLKILDIICENMIKAIRS